MYTINYLKQPNYTRNINYHYSTLWEKKHNNQ